MKVKVILFRRSGKYYTEEEWEVPAEVPDSSEYRGDYVREALGPWDMIHSPDFHRIANGAVLVESQEPWGYPHLFPAPTVAEVVSRADVGSPHSCQGAIAQLKEML